MSSITGTFPILWFGIKPQPHAEEHFALPLCYAGLPSFVTLTIGTFKCLRLYLEVRQFKKRKVYLNAGGCSGVFQGYLRLVKKCPGLKKVCE